MRKGRFTLAAAGAALATMAWSGTPAMAQEGMEEAGPNTGAISFSVGTDVVTEYYFRGIAQENQGFIAQPWAEFGIALYESEDGPLDSIDFTMGIWNSIHTGPSGEDGAGDPHYELDFYTGFSVGLMEKWTVDILYTAYTSPNDLFTTTQEISVGVGYDDSGLYTAFGLSEDFGLAPSALIAFEFEGGADAGTELGTYLEIGIEPSFPLTEGDYPLTLSIPMTAGFSLDGDYYESSDGDDFFGYFDIGANVSMPLDALIPTEFGSWEVYAGIHALVLGNTTEQIAEVDFAVDGDADFEVYGVFGISMSY